MFQGNAISDRTMLRLARLTLLLLFATATWAQQPATQTLKPAGPTLGTITGRVVSPGGEPLTGATVYVSTIGAMVPPRSVAVDSSGSFRLEGLDVGVYLVSANVPGFVSETPTLPNDPRRYHHTGDSVTLTLIKGGVITGVVTTGTNAPVVATNVRAFRVRDENGQPLRGLIQFRDRVTDDRGVYRIYGLQPGVYVVSAGGPDRFYGQSSLSAYDNDAPTYAPSSTRDTASEISVHSGEEATVDIEYRGEAGHAISGTLAGVSQSPSTFVNVTLTDVRTRASLMGTPAASFNNYTFAFYGVADGEYELLAQRYSSTGGDASASEPRLVKVQGGDLTGITLTLVPLASIAGRIILESNPPADCVKHRATALPETVITARRLNKETEPAAAKTAKVQPAPRVPLAYVSQNVDSVPDGNGEFTLRSLQAGTYRIEPQPPGAGWYVRSIALGPAPQVTTAAQGSDSKIARDGITLKSGERVSGLSVIVTEGAAMLRGRITIADAEQLPSGLRIHLAPAERERAVDVLRFAEAPVNSDGTFAIGNIAPGHYRAIVRTTANGSSEPTLPIALQDAARADLLREAETAGAAIEFKACQRIVDFELHYVASSPASPVNRPAKVPR